MPVKKRLGEMLIEAGAIDETQLQAALGHQRKWGGKLGQALLDLRLASEPQIVSALSRKFGYPVVNVSALVASPQLEGVLRLIPRELALRQTLLPITADTSSITVVMADPSNVAVVDELSFRTGRRVKVALAGDREIAAAVRRLYFAEEEAQRTQAIPLDESHADGLEMVGDPFASAAPGPPPLPSGRGRAAPPPAAAPFADDPDPLGEPILATELAPLEPGDAPPPAGGPPGDALQGALARAEGGEGELGPRPSRLLAALVRVLVKRGLVTEEELLEALMRKD